MSIVILDLMVDLSCLRIHKGRRIQRKQILTNISPPSCLEKKKIPLLVFVPRIHKFFCVYLLHTYIHILFINVCMYIKYTFIIDMRVFLKYFPTKLFLIFYSVFLFLLLIFCCCSCWFSGTANHRIFLITALNEITRRTD